ncbi:sensor histidine kinase [Ectobacillus panaciterrae]|uniref:sensor histidine kinase n=1 Tax=Ectobacillus panaciterrae TaxID=363872 RepID=UPI0004014BCB|nr:HAMP domain-containing sensor histidine kinase [Ectobacillus panaciterrae]
MTLFYIGMFISLWTIGIVLLVNNYKNKYTCWMSTLLIIAGFASFSLVINQTFLPFLKTHGYENLLFSESIRILTIVLWGIEYHFLPYLFLMSGIVFTDYLSRKMQNWLSFILLIPIILYIIYFVPIYPEAKFGGILFKALSGIYFLSGILFYIISYLRENNSVYKGNRFRTNLVVIAISFVYASDYYGLNYFLISKSGLEISSNNLWQLNFLIVIWLVLFFIYFGLRYGFMGIKLRIEQQKLDYSMRSLTQGTAILNHTLKNEVQKINYLSEKIADSISRDCKDEALQDIASILNVTDHMLNMVTRIKEKADEIILNEQPQQLTKLLEIQLASLSTILQEKNILLHKDYRIDPEIICDPAHIQETFSNICMNAIESMEAGKGRLEIILVELKRDVVIWIKDNGTGIPKENVAKVFEPFFTTKKGRLHYGLGLSYCYGVMQKHGGGLQILKSEPGEGTLMELRFPRKRVLHWVIENEVNSSSRGMTEFHPPAT